LDVERNLKIKKSTIMVEDVERERERKKKMQERERDRRHK
jgi:hypothetical protein